ncbi:MAG: hypothetical protein AAF423_13980 [Pseudomonadota bacterium]
MTKTILDPDEFAQQRKVIFTDIGLPGSGYARYSAAMYFHKLGRLSLDLLEIYRRCSKWDHEDPVILASLEGVEPVTPDELKFA